jgi:hypothetical protein
MICTNLVGTRFGRLEVIERSHNNNKGNSRWVCRCDCGNEVVVLRYQLTSGKTKSCGCINKERITKLGYRMVRHGHHKGDKPTKLYKTWQGIKSRCLNKNNKNYSQYGARGITISTAWLDFLTFVNDVGEPPFENAQLDRIDNNGNYELGNCRWVTAKENAQNRGNVIRAKLQKNCVHLDNDNFLFCPLCGMAFSTNRSKAGVVNG